MCFSCGRSCEHYLPVPEISLTGATGGSGHRRDFAFWAWRRVITWKNQLHLNQSYQNSSSRWESNAVTGFCQILLAVSSERCFSIPVMRSLTLPDRWRLQVDSHLQESHQVTEPADFHLVSTFNILMNSVETERGSWQAQRHFKNMVSFCVLVFYLDKCVRHWLFADSVWINKFLVLTKNLDEVVKYHIRENPIKTGFCFYPF